MYIDVVPNRNSNPAVLLRESFREGGRVRKRTLANLGMLPPHAVEALRQALKRKDHALNLDQLPGGFAIDQALPYGHLAAVLGTMTKLGMANLIDRTPTKRRQRVLALIAAQVVAADSKLATASGLAKDDALGALNLALGLGSLDSDDLYDAMDYLLERQEQIETRLAKKHLSGGLIVLYDVSSSSYHGLCCPLARHGYSRDHRRDLPQIVYGVLCNAQGVPVAAKVFEGNTADPATLADAVDQVSRRFGLTRVVLVGDRGLITETRITKDLKPAGIDYLTALRAPAIRQLAGQGHVQMSLFDEQDLYEVRSDDYPGERLVVCRNPALAEERSRKRTVLLDATETNLKRIADAVTRPQRPLRGATAIALRVGKVLDRHKMAKHFDLDIRDDGLTFTRNQASIQAEQELDGIYVIRTSVEAAELSAQAAVGTYKQLASVERVFRSVKSFDLQVRPIRHRREDRVRAHVFLCLLAYYVQWHMRQALAPLLFEDDDPASGTERRSVVAPAARSPAADAKAARKQNRDGQRVQSFRTLMRSLGTLTVNQITPDNPAIPSFYKLSTPTPLQQQAFDLLGIQPAVWTEPRI